MRSCDTTLQHQAVVHTNSKSLSTTTSEEAFMIYHVLVEKNVYSKQKHSIRTRIKQCERNAELLNTVHKAKFDETKVFL